MKLSIVTTLYYSSAYINEFYKRTKKTAEGITKDFEIIFVDDGSPDNSLELAVAIAEHDSRVKVIELSRNFGHHKAIMTGLRHARGDYIFLIDSDLEEEPELLKIFWEKMQEENDLDVVYGYQAARKGNWFERVSGKIFWNMINKMSYIDIPENMITARLTTRRYNDSLLEYNENQIFLGGVWPDVGFKQIGVKVNKHDQSNSTYTFSKKISMFIDSITSFSNKPLVYIFNTGLLITLISLIYIVKLIYDKIVLNISIEGWSSIVVSIWFFGGLIILSLGIIAMYLSKMFLEIKRRPFTIIKKIHKKKGNNEN